ncbi:hypothetical protein GCM10009527_022740 [Actinomadura nitritigenes]|uniref:Uncharacterized protein n=1 Tax=Actinomadura nitritigenes TaxID=134602 RepID=A0ABS3RCT0_9ACTN|nr:hypothetical protein [Actinomadura nitritigenes]MBO2444042.1 hypothetical protein [Actinomadura nitritigenes]
MSPARKTRPRYFTYNERPVVFVEPPGGGLDCVACTPWAGDFVRETRYFSEINFNRDADIEELPYEDFVPAVEIFRARNGLGEGAVKALYETMDGLEKTAEQERRPLSAEERALIRSISKRTHPLFEEYLGGRGLAGTPPPVPAALRIARVFDEVGADGTPRYDRPAVPEHEREALLRYLREAPIVLAARGYDTDRLDPARPAEVPLTYHTDGTWIWPGAVHYYLRVHGVPPEPRLVGYASAENFRVPEVDEETRAEAVATINRPAE